TDVLVEVLDVRGGVVWSDESFQMPTPTGATETVTWDGSGGPPGVYFVRVTAYHTDTCQGEAWNHPNGNPTVVDRDQSESPLSLTATTTYDSVPTERNAELNVDYTISDEANHLTPLDGTL